MRSMRSMDAEPNRPVSRPFDAPNEPIVESVKNGTNRLQKYVCAAESAQVERANEPTRRSEVPVRPATESPLLRASQTDVLVQCSSGSIFVETGPVPKNGTRKEGDLA
jgi:hypothetical protein